MLVAARNSQDLASCFRATASARSKYSSAFVAFCSGESCSDFPGDAIDLGLEPLFLGGVCHGKRLANAAPGIIELSKLCIGQAQM